MVREKNAIYLKDNIFHHSNMSLQYKKIDWEIININNFITHSVFNL